MPGRDMWQQWKEGVYRVTTDPSALDIDAVHEFLNTTTWALGLSRDALVEATRHSVCFSLLEAEMQIGFARVITDRVTYAYLCDVYIAESHRNQGLGRWLMRCVLDHDTLKRLKRIALLTHDAEIFYRGLGFSRIKRGSTYLERLQPSTLLHPPHARLPVASE